MQEQNKHNKTCIKCREDFIWYEKDTWWDYTGMTDTKLVKCPDCNTINVVKFKELHDVNNDKRYYEYNRKRAIKKMP